MAWGHVLLLLSLLVCFHPSSLQQKVTFSEQKFYHKAVGTDNEHVKLISDMSSDLDVFRKAMRNICIERVVGTPGHKKVQEFIKTEMHILGWDITEDKFSAKTPFGDKTFNNIIATHNPKSRRFLDIACHYDSKYFKNDVFLAATDSAAPCSMMIQMAHNLRKILNDKKQSEISLRFIFFDGEEAFVNWNRHDSLYGSRHLAQKWQNEPYPEGGGDSTQLDRIDMLVLLDLLGAKHPTFYNFYSDTQPWYKILVGAEEKLGRNGLFRSYSHSYFKRMSTHAGIEDDHLPFRERDVPILHLIPVPFPKEWHTPKDSPDIIDESTVSNLIKIISTFISEYMHLNT